MSKDLRQYQAGENVDKACILTANQTRETKSGKPYLQLELGDSSGRVAAVMWDGFDENAMSLQAGEIVHVNGRMDTYRDKIQLVVQRLIRLDPSKCNPRELLPSSERDPAEMLSELDRHVELIADPGIRTLMENIFGDTEIRQSFTNAPAAKRWHQPYIGGLIEHTLNVLNNAVSLAGRYPEVSLDIVRAGTLVHDLGKIVEYNVDTFFDTSTEGRLLGHLVIGCEIVERFSAGVGNLPKEVVWHIKHIVLSHHGSLEFGSPVVPRTLEALIVHFADDLDAKMNGVMRIMKRESDDPGEWTSYIRLMEREFFKGSILDNPSPPKVKPSKQLETSRDNLDNRSDEEQRNFFQ